MPSAPPSRNSLNKLLNAVVELDLKPLFFDDFVIRTAIKDVRVSVDFVAFAHGNRAHEFYGQLLADFLDVFFRDVLTVGAVAEPCADLLIELAEQKRVALEREFGGFFFFGKGVFGNENYFIQAKRYKPSIVYKDNKKACFRFRSVGCMRIFLLLVKNRHYLFVYLQ